MREPSPYREGVKVWDSKGESQGVMTGHQKCCGLDGCTGIKVKVRWPDGKHTWPCTKGLSTYRDGFNVGVPIKNKVSDTKYVGKYVWDSSRRWVGEVRLERQIAGDVVLTVEWLFGLMHHLVSNTEPEGDNLILKDKKMMGFQPSDPLKLFAAYETKGDPRVTFPVFSSAECPANRFTSDVLTEVRRTVPAVLEPLFNKPVYFLRNPMWVDLPDVGPKTGRLVGGLNGKAVINLGKKMQEIVEPDLVFPCTAAGKLALLRCLNALVTDTMLKQAAMREALANNMVRLSMFSGALCETVQKQLGEPKKK